MAAEPKTVSTGIFVCVAVSPPMPMVPTLSVYVAPNVLYGAVVRPGTKGLQLDAIAVVPYSGEIPFEHVRDQLGTVAWSELVVVVESSHAAVAMFPIEPEQSSALVREQVELEIIQQFLSTPSQGYTADVYRIGPDVDGCFMAAAVCMLAEQHALVESIHQRFGVIPRTTVAPVALAAAFTYNYPEQRGRRYALAHVGNQSVEVLVLENAALRTWTSVPVQGSVETALQQAVRHALVASGDVHTLYLAGTGLTRQRYQQLVVQFDGRFAEPVALLDGLRMLQCAIRAELCRAVAPLGHVLAPAVGAALQPLYIAPAWSIDTLHTHEAVE
jgi:hypothetical protein